MRPTKKSTPSSPSSSSSQKKKKENGLGDGNNVFHKYMHRKIELNRQQFCLILPPTKTKCSDILLRGGRRKRSHHVLPCLI
mmetsp:Transcript_25097/g.37456  ORF Transcript_25097/g.37456 Transcript_25097/m.37456 type:complete len:81 (+) Transcript_25097:263-505(+)